MEITKTWAEIKSILSIKKLKLQYEEMTDSPARYFLFMEEGLVVYTCKFLKSDTDAVDFETNYKAGCNQSLKTRNGDGREVIMTTSRPMCATTCFASAGDNSELGIGEGPRMLYDFENNNDLVTAPSGYKRKQINFSFIDPVWLKEGTVYFHNTLKNSYIDLFIMCPEGQYYLKNDGSVGLASEDMPVEHFAIKLPIQGSCPMGDEFNTESCSNEIPPDYFFRTEVTVPDTDNVSNGYVNIEIYRERTVILI